MNKQITINGTILSEADLLQAADNILLPDWERQVYAFVINWFDHSEEIEQKTSGSTGSPKKIMLKKSMMVASAQKTIRYFDLKSGQVAWLCLPVQYIAGKMMVVRAIEARLNLVISEPLSRPVIPFSKVDFAALVPMQMHKMLSAGEDISRISKLILGGSAVDFKLLKHIEKLSCEVYATYGMTETSSHIALQRLNGSKPDAHFKVLDGFSVATDAHGCLQIIAPEFFSGVLQTTDVVELISPVAFRWLGRADHVINSGGIKISPEPIEKEISLLINSECVITSLPDEALGQKLVLIVEGSADDFSKNLLIDKIKQRFEKHLVPKLVYYLDALPRTSSMKVDRAELAHIMKNNKLD